MDLEKKTLVASSIKATDAKADKAAEADGELQDSLTCRNIVQNLVFSNWYKGNQPLFGNGTFASVDSAYTTSGRHLTNMQEALNHTIAINEMSNGMTRVPSTSSPSALGRPIIPSLNGRLQLEIIAIRFIQ